MIRFAHPEFLYSLALLPLLLGIYIYARRARLRALRRFGTDSLLERLTPSAGRYRQVLKFSFLFAAVGFLVLGLANPQIGSRMEEVKREGVDIFIALDVSSSMVAEDIRPNRLQSAVREISQLIDQLQNDRIGIVVFAGDSYLQLPLTDDYGAAKLMLSTIDIDIVPIQGTAIGSAIKLAMRSFVQGETKHKAIIVITDGENHEDDAIEAAKEAAAEGVVVHTIGMGTSAGSPIPVYRDGAQVGFKQDGSGNIVVTKLDEIGLQQIAEAGGGKYVRASSAQNELDIVFKDIQSMEKKEFGTKVFTDYQDRFQYFLAVALFLLLAEFFISERRNKLVEHWRGVVWRPLTGRHAADKGGV